ncbi:hypothetical protein DPMN_080533 [Dreissena polymorpha]|uniref:Uncharacterized protein n=1 Tax=Dreissena polymorpha TaxID=45954 RepID=A0A9D3YVB3_DREPO|nr:hypothetical protein DPMN_080533 [Dreissena polymorpha]
MSTLCSVLVSLVRSRGLREDDEGLSSSGVVGKGVAPVGQIETGAAGGLDRTDQQQILMFIVYGYHTLDDAVPASSKRFGFTGGDGGSSDKKRKGKEESKRKYEGKKKFLPKWREDYK